MFIDIFNDLLNESGLNKRQFAQLSDIPYSTVVGWTNLNRLPDFNALAKIADYFQCSVDYLMGREGDLGKPLYFAEPLQFNEKQLVRRFRELGQEERDVLLFIMDKFSSRA